MIFLLLREFFMVFNNKSEREIELSFLCINPKLLINILRQYKPSYLLETYYTEINKNTETRYMKIYDYRNETTICLIVIWII